MPGPFDERFFPAGTGVLVRHVLRGHTLGRDWPSLSEEEEGAFAAASELHGIGPLLYSRMRLAVLREPAMRAAALETLRLVDLQDVLSALEAGGVQVLIVKGSALAYDLYPSPEMRPRGDVDLFIDESHRQQAVAILEEAGFASQITSGDELIMRQRLFTRTDASGATHAYDLHWRLFNPSSFAHILRFSDLRSRAIALPRISPAARGLSHRDALMLACVHRAAHHHGSDRLIWLYDIHLLHEELDGVERSEFWRAAASGGVVTICRHAITLAADWFGGRGDDSAGWLSPSELRRVEATAAYLQAGRSRGALLIEDLRALRSWRDRLTRLGQLAFPPVAFIRSAFPKAGRRALPWLYLYRAVRGVRRLFGRVA